MQTTPYILTPYPETTDIADIPKQMRDIAYSWENAWGGVWLTWSPVVTQAVGGIPAALVLNLSTSVARVRKIGRTVYVQAMLNVTSGAGAGDGYPLVQIPYPVADINIPAGVVWSSVGGSISGVAALVPHGGAYADNPSYIESFGTSTARVLGDWIALLLKYETV